MQLRIALILSSLLISNIAFAKDGVIDVKSTYDVATTANNLEKILKAKGMTVFARIDHAKGAHKVGKTLRPTQLIVFGNPKVGTPLMQCAQSIALDLPQKALIWQDAKGQVWLSYNNPAYIARRHNLKGCEAPLKKVTGALAKFSAAATKKAH